MWRYQLQGVSKVIPSNIGAHIKRILIFLHQTKYIQFQKSNPHIDGSIKIPNKNSKRILKDFNFQFWSDYLILPQKGKISYRSGGIKNTCVRSNNNRK